MDQTDQNSNKTRTIITVIVCVIFMIGIAAAFFASKKDAQAPTKELNATSTTSPVPIGVSR